MTNPPYDFRAPPPADIERQVTAWIEEVCRRSRIVWPGSLPFTIMFSHQPATIVTSRVASESIDPNAFAVLCQTDSPASSMFIGLPSSLLHGLIAGLLGETPAAAPVVDRPLTSLEKPLFEYVARDLIAAVWTSAWLVPNGPKMAVADMGPVRSLWRMSGEMCILTKWLMATPFGDFECPVILPRSEWSNRFPKEMIAQKPAHTLANQARIESLVRSMGIDLSVDLGTAEVTLVELTKLRVGDLIVLNQKVSDPLCARVGGESKLKVWPGLVGNRHAVQVHTVLGPDSAPVG